jgi:phosphopantetheine adenylyltransferase
MSLDTSKGLTHLNHLEDNVLLMGKDGAVVSSDIIKKFVSKFENNAENTEDLTISEKGDGRTSLYFGTNPSGQFFIGTKGVLSKGEQKIAYSLSDINRLYQGGVEVVLANAFNNLKNSKIERGFACQGDLLWYEKSGKSESVIEGKQYLTFQPNTILYGIPVDNKSNIYKKASKANLGIVLHGVYEIHFIEGERIEFTRLGVQEVKDLTEGINQNSNVFCIHPFIENLDVLSSSKEILRELSETIKTVEQSTSEIDPQFDREWIKGENEFVRTAKTYLPQFINHQVRVSGEQETILTAKDEKEFLKRFKTKFKEFMNVKSKFEVDKMKSLKGKEQKNESFKNFLNWMNEYEKTFEPMFLCFFRLFNIKTLLLQLLDQVEKKIGQTFEIKAVKPEGYVFLSGPNMVKIVDRLEFSRNNMLYGRFAEESEISSAIYDLNSNNKSFVDSVVEDVLSAMEATKTINDGWNDQQILEATTNMKNYCVIYVGRFQPPTIAHVQNIVNLAKLFKEVYVFISKADNMSPKYLQKNPLTDDERIKLFDSDPKLKLLTNVNINSGPTSLVYGINSINSETGRPNEEELRNLLDIPEENQIVVALGKEDDRYFAIKDTRKFFDINSGQKPSDGKKFGLYGIDLISAGESKISATVIRTAIIGGELETAERFLAGAEGMKEIIINNVYERISMANSSLENKTNKQKKRKEIDEEIDLDGIDRLTLEDAFDVILNTLEE